MREIDPQSDRQLAEALRRLAASSPRSAPEELGAGLLHGFRRHHARRRVRRTLLVATSLCLTAGIALASLKLAAGRRHELSALGAPSSSANTRAAQTSAPKNTTQPAGNSAISQLRPDRRRSAPRQGAGAPGNRKATRAAFVALPGYDPAVPMDQLNVVRVRLPESALWKMGAPIPADAGTRQVMADFVVSQDGTPFAVRLVQ